LKKYKISIITICYNNLLDLVKTYTSLSNYLSNEVEWVVIDGSTNLEINQYLNNIKKYNIFYLFEKDSGIYDAMNKGIKFSNGDYLRYF
jgi:putative colanic acid biosynthesis glycosyltransferase